MIRESGKISYELRHSGLFIVLFLFLATPMEIQSADQIKLLLNFEDIDNSGRWMVVNDGVMGGVSRSNINLHSDGYLVFAGQVSTKYGGGFASVRTYDENWEIGKYEGFILRVKGDGKTYQFRCRMGENIFEIAYRNYFQAKKEDWQEIFKYQATPDETYAAEWENFIACINQGSQPLITGADGLEVLKVIGASRLSAKAKRQVEID
jgi:predicted dehydrogenase